MQGKAFPARMGWPWRRGAEPLTATWMDKQMLHHPPHESRLAMGSRQTDRQTRWALHIPAFVSREQGPGCMAAARVWHTHVRRCTGRQGWRMMGQPQPTVSWQRLLAADPARQGSAAAERGSVGTVPLGCSGRRGVTGAGRPRAQCWAPWRAGQAPWGPGHHCCPGCPVVPLTMVPAACRTRNARDAGVPCARCSAPATPGRAAGWRAGDVQAGQRHVAAEP